MNGGSLNFTNPANLNGGALIGTGNITGSINNNLGNLSPGHSPGNVNVNGNFAQGSGGRLTTQLGGLASGSQFDRLGVNGSVTLGGALNVQVINNFAPAAGDTFKIVDNLTGSPCTGTFAGLPEGATFVASERLFRITYTGGDGNDVVLTALLPTVSGRVYKFETVNGTVVKVGLPNVTVKLGSSRTTTTGANGTYSFADVAAGSYLVQPVPPATNFEFNPHTRSITVAGKVLTGLRFETYNLSGRVTKLNPDETRTGLAGAKITVNGIVRATTDANGFYSITGLGAAAYNVTAVLSGFTFPTRTIGLPTDGIAGVSPNAKAGFLGTPTASQVEEPPSGNEF
jgi:hypothetical protein